MLQAQGHIGILAGIVANGCRRKVAHILLSAATRTDERLYLDGVILEVHFGEVIHTVAEFGL